MVMVDTEQYRITIPNEDGVYYDTVLDSTITVKRVDRDTRNITYREDNDRNNTEVESFKQFFSWLAAHRFIYIGERVDGGIVSSRSDIIDAFRQVFVVDEKDDFDRAARRVFSDKIGEDINSK